ncbi:helix-turn-helix domain-containing protein [Mycolicibacterium mucogenicum]|jgi:DNA-binding PucR family transcriptional regulator|uniref:PucR family transcriptional regulator n=1 Tax=Mycolicibacterium mucogenicum TaxID=56689 RepID=UPI002269B81C|nr:helix-turn-helix domain-containing protein [Mycolicibacterium mucogenicum]MCX8564087.1 helix-turn-helix domain-containing protein [Mycolicibacterium mucogenicum]
MDPAVSEANNAIMTRLIARQTEVARSVGQRLASDITELRGDPEIIELLRASVGGNVETIFHALRYDISLENIEAPTAALEYARRLAQRGVPMNALTRAYRIGHALVLDVAGEEINRAGFAPQTSLAFFERLTSVTFRYIDWISQQVVTVYEDERDRWLANRNSTQALRVREVLSGNDSDPEAITAAIRYPMRRRHLGVVLWWPTGSGHVTGHDDALAKLEQFLRAAAEHVGTQGSPLFLAADQRTGWGWLPLSGATAPAASAQLRQFTDSHPNAPAVAIGIPLPGVDGFRRSHRQALRAHSVAVTADLTGVTAADDPGFAAAALMGENQDDAREFVHTVLGPLAGAGDNDARLRETLQVFLRHGGSYTAAADELVVHFNTVKYRVGRALERRGRPLGDDRLDIEMALLLCQWYAAAVLLDE